MNEFIKDFGLLINAMLIATPPLLYAALGSCISERSGVVNIGIEGMMTVGAFTGAALCYFVPGAPWLAFVLAGVAGALVAVIHYTGQCGERSDLFQAVTVEMQVVAV